MTSPKRKAAELAERYHHETGVVWTLDEVTERGYHKWGVRVAFDTLPLGRATGMAYHAADKAEAEAIVAILDADSGTGGV